MNNIKRRTVRETESACMHTYTQLQTQKQRLFYGVSK